jgi:heme/copper-type cytochrome/quinol oxidase subunit 3
LIFIIILIFFIIWITLLIIESIQGFQQDYIKNSFKLGFLIFLIREIILFLCFFWYYFDNIIVESLFNFLASSFNIINVNNKNQIILPIINTFVLLIRGTLISIVFNKLCYSNINKKFFIISLILGIIFIIIQLFEYWSINYRIIENNFFNIFYSLTGIHGIHVFIGLIFLLFCYFKYNTLNKKRIILIFRIIYWHFVDIIWLFLFLVIYYYRNLKNNLKRILICLIKSFLYINLV